MKFKRRMIALCLAVLLVAGMGLLSGCKGSGSGYPVEVGGVTVTKQPSGVVVLSDNLADIIIALDNNGASYISLLKGKSKDCTQEELVLLQDYTIDDAAKIKSSGADTVLLDAEPTAAQRSALEEQGLQVIVLAPATNRESLIQLYQSVASLLQGKETGTARGEKIAESTLMTLDDIERSIPTETSTPTACYVYDTEGHVVTGDTMAGKLFAYAGLINIYQSETGSKVDLTVTRSTNPQYIFCPVGMKDTIVNSSVYANTDAVKNGKVYEIDETLMRRQGGSLIQAVTALAGDAYPELISDARSKENDRAILDTQVFGESEAATE